MTSNEHLKEWEPGEDDNGTIRIPHRYPGSCLPVEEVYHTQDELTVARPRAGIQHYQPLSINNVFHHRNAHDESQPHHQRTDDETLRGASYNYLGQQQVQCQEDVECLDDSCHHLVPDWVEYLSGGSAAIVNIAATFPINKLIFRQQLFSIRLPKAMKQLRHEGMRNLYRGVLPPLIQRTVTLSMMFGLYDQYTRIILNTFPNCSLVKAQMTAAVLSGELDQNNPV